MTLRGLPGALALGLLASLVAHATLFGGEHAMGGAYHALLLQAAAAACVGLLATFCALAWAGAGQVADGSVLARRLTDRLPGFAPLVAASGGWFALIEALEPHHAEAPLLATLLCLVVAAWLLLAAARGVTRAIAKAAIAVARTPFSPRVPVWTRRVRPAPLVRRSPLLRRRFARPPPIANACA
jgi:hypothetical protein